MLYRRPEHRVFHALGFGNQLEKGRILWGGGVEAADAGHETRVSGVLDRIHDADFAETCQKEEVQQRNDRRALMFRLLAKAKSLVSEGFSVFLPALRKWIPQIVPHFATNFPERFLL